MRLLPVATVVLSTLAAACGSSPEPTFYALAPVRGAAQTGLPHAIEIRRLSIPGYLDRPEIVRGLVRYRLAIEPNDRWAAPLDEMLGRVLAEDLEERSPGSLVFTDAGAITVDPDATVEIDLQRLDVDASGELRLVAEVAVERGEAHGAAESRAVVLKRARGGGGTAAMVGSISALMGELADQVTVLLRGSDGAGASARR